MCDFIKKTKVYVVVVLVVFAALLLLSGEAQAENYAETVSTENVGNSELEELRKEAEEEEEGELPDPNLKNGWYEEADGLYYYINDVCQTGWLELEEGTFFLDDSGKAVTNRWILHEGDWYYFDSEHRMTTNAWQRDSVAWCYLLEDGKAAKNQWVYWNGGWYYLKAGCHMAANEWARDSVNWCYLLSDGRAATNKWVRWNGGWYYLKGDCRMAEKAWVRDSVAWCYLGEGGRAYDNGWRWIGNTEYRFSSSARMVGAWMDVPCMMQNPELPTGCESVALTNTLNYYGFGLNKTTMANKYVSRSTTDFVTSFLGDPYSYSNGGMICAPGIVIAANKYLEETESKLRAHELTGASLWALCQDRVANGRPVILWTSIGYSTGGYRYRERTYNGRTYFAHTMSHTVVLNGFDDEEGVVWISDSISGKVKRSYSLVKSVYELHGSQAVVLY